jgi:signal transduction histidine kinase
MAEEEAERLNNLVRDLLDFARPRQADRRQHPLAPLIASAVQSARSAGTTPGIEVRVDLQQAPITAWVDEPMLRQALINLLLNAAQAMPQGGHVTVSARREEASSGTVLRIDVSDDGPGIDCAALEKVFQPFYTTRAMGTGLGLAVVKSIAEAHQGQATLEPSAKGATFSLRIPLDPPPST